jgi:prevent-host-death family protein
MELSAWAILASNVVFRKPRPVYIPETSGLSAKRRAATRSCTISRPSFPRTERSIQRFLDKKAKRDMIAIIMKTLAAPIDPILGELRAFDASSVKNKFRDVAEQAAKGAVAISRYSRPELVIMSAEEYVRLEKLRRAPFEALTGQFDDLVTRMQTAKSKKAVQALFGSTPVELGRAAVKSAKANVR